MDPNNPISSESLPSQPSVEMPVAQNVPPSAPAGSFPSIGALFSQSWEAFTKSLLNLFLIGLISLPIYFVLIIGSILVFGFGAFFIGFMNGASGTSPNALMNAFSSLNVGLLIIGFVVMVIVFSVVATVFQIAAIFAVDEHSQSPSLRSLFGKSFRSIIPLWVASFLMGILIYGGFFVFVIPGFLFYAFFLFAPFEVLLNNKRGLASLRRSMGMVSRNFGHIFIRLLALYGIAFLIAFIPMIMSSTNSNLGLLFSLVQFVVNIFMGWFVLAYLVTLYKHARIGYENETGAKLLWVWIVAILGWLIMSAVFFFAYQAFSSGAFKNLFNKAVQESSKTTTNEVKQKENPLFDQYITSGNVKVNTASQIAEKTPLTAQDKDQIIALFNGATSDYKKAIEVDPNNFLGYYNLAYTYSLMPSAQNSDEFAVYNFEKALTLNPKYTEAYIQLGGVYYRKENYDKAIEYFQKAIGIEPDNANAWFNLGMSYKMTGAKTEAKKALQKFLDLLPQDEPTRYRADKELQGL